MYAKEGVEEQAGLATLYEAGVRLLSKGTVAVDCEWNRGKQLTLLQIAADGWVLLFQPAEGMAELPTFLDDLFSDADITKVGLAVSNDMRILARAFPNQKLLNFVDIVEYTAEYGFPADNADGSPGSLSPSLTFLARHFLGVVVRHDQDLSTSFSAQGSGLTRAQVEYAACDAFLCYDLFEALCLIQEQNRQKDFVRPTLRVGKGPRTPDAYPSPDDRAPTCTYDGCKDAYGHRQLSTCKRGQCTATFHRACFKAIACHHSSQDVAVCGDCFVPDGDVMDVDLPDVVVLGVSQAAAAQKPVQVNGRSLRALTRENTVAAEAQSSSEDEDWTGKVSGKQQTNIGFGVTSRAERMARKDGASSGTGIRPFFSHPAQTLRPTGLTDGPARGRRGQGPAPSEDHSGLAPRVAAERDQEEEEETTSPSRRAHVDKDASPVKAAGSKARSRSRSRADSGPDTSGSPRHAPTGAEGGPELS
jgi:hypothetical protein